MKIRTLHSPNRVLQIGNQQVAFHEGIAKVEDLELAKFICSLKGFVIEEDHTEDTDNKSNQSEEAICKKSMQNSSGEVENTDENKNVDLESLSTAELKKMAKEAGVYKSGMNKQEIISSLK